jgi:hypothetical protein
MTKRTPKKMSRREREEQRQMRRWMMFGGGAMAVAAAAGVGVTLLPPSFPSLTGEGSMAARITGAGLDGRLMNLTPAPSTLLAIGTTDCVHCQTFVREGLDKIVEFARNENIGFVFASTGSSRKSLGSTRLISGFASAGIAQSKVVQEVYAEHQKLGTPEGLSEVAHDIGLRYGLDEAQIAEILSEDDLVVTQRIQALGQAFPIKGTPSFYIESASVSDRISWFNGWPGVEGAIRQIRFAREA